MSINENTLDIIVKVVFLLAAPPILYKMFWLGLGYDVNFGRLDNFMTVLFAYTMSWVGFGYFNKD